MIENRLRINVIFRTLDYTGSGNYLVKDQTKQIAILVMKVSKPLDNTLHPIDTFNRYPPERESIKSGYGGSAFIVPRKRELCRKSDQGNTHVQA
jgi:hypothetical protein